MPLSARQRHAIQMAFRWRADECPTLGFVTFRGPEPLLVRYPILCVFSGGPAPLSTPPSFIEQFIF